MKIDWKKAYESVNRENQFLKLFGRVENVNRVNLISMGKTEIN